MKAIGILSILFGWLSSVQGYGPSQIGMVLFGVAVFIGGAYLGKR